MYAQAIGNIILGGLAIILNLALIWAFLSNKRRRRTYPLLLTLAFGDVLSALSFLGYGINRLYKQILNDTNSTSPAYCLATVYPIVTPMSQILIALITLFIASDRFCAMRLPIFYYRNIKPVKYYPYLGLVVLMALIFTCVGVYQYSVRLTSLPWHCGTPHAVDDIYNNIRFGVAGFGGLLAVTIYCLALIPSGYRYKDYSQINNFRNDLKFSKDPMQNGLPLSFIRRQAKTTKEILLVMIFTFILYAMPMFQYWLLFGLKVKWPFLLFIAPYAGWLCQIHSTLNVVLLFFLSQDIRTIFLKTILPAYCWQKRTLVTFLALHR